MNKSIVFKTTLLTPQVFCEKHVQHHLLQRAILMFEPVECPFPNFKNFFNDLSIGIDFKGQYIVGNSEREIYCTTLEDAHWGYMRILLQESTFFWHMQSADDVKELLQYFIVDLGLGAGFHPDTDMVDYINMVTDKPTFTGEQATYLQLLLNEAFLACEKLGVNIHELACEVYCKSLVSFPQGGIFLYKGNIAEIGCFDALEVHPVAIVSLDGDMQHCEPVSDDNDAHFWCVYGHLKEGGTICLADCQTAELANNVCALMESGIRNFVSRDTSIENKRLVALSEIVAIIEKLPKLSDVRAY